MIYTHVLNQGGQGVRSPLDLPDDLAGEDDGCVCDADTSAVFRNPFSRPQTFPPARMARAQCRSPRCPTPRAGRYATQDRFNTEY
jgi:hypothetical protein